MRKENDILEETLALAENGYAEAYRFLLDAYEQNPGGYGPQTLYFLACLAGGANMPEAALAWMRTAIEKNGWWYRPEVLEDDDLALLNGNPAFLALKSVSDSRYEKAVAETKAVFSWKEKKAENLLLAVHGNTQNRQIAESDWRPVLTQNAQWQLETVQSGEPDGFGTYRWSYDRRSCLPVAEAMEKIQSAGYKKILCGGFSAGCDMLLRAVLLPSARCDVLVLQSPWLPVLQDSAEELMRAVRQKEIALKIFCGAQDEDCLPMARQLYALAGREGVRATMTTQESSRHQFPAEQYTIKDLL